MNMDPCGSESASLILFGTIYIEDMYSILELAAELFYKDLFNIQTRFHRYNEKKLGNNVSALTCMPGENPGPARMTAARAGALAESIAWEIINQSLPRKGTVGGGVVQGTGNIILRLKNSVADPDPSRST